MKRVSLSDIAKKLGVSTAVVSLVLNKRADQFGIKKETQERVRAMVEKLNYRPDQIARGLRLRRTNTIGLVLTNISDIFFAEIASSITDNAGKQGFNVLVCNSNENEKKEKRELNLLLDRRVDGLIISTTQFNEDIIKQMNRDNYPFVLIDRYFPKIDTNYVVFDNFNGAFEAITHLLKLGYTRIGQLTITPYLTPISERDRGYRKALEKQGIKYESELTREVPFENVLNGVEEAIKKLLNPPLSIKALFVHNNVMAAQAIQCLTQMKIRVPQDVAVVSFGDRDLFQVCNSPVTCVRMPTYEIGENAVKILLDEIQKKEPAKAKKKVVVPTELIIRESCGVLIN